MIYVDTREKKNKHILKYFDKHGIQYQREKLDECDYASDQSDVLIERKQDLEELAGNITKENGRRLKAEFRRVPQGKRVIVLIEEKMNGLEDVPNWRGKHMKLMGPALYCYMVSYQRRHNLEYIFCHKNSTGKIIAELLGERGR